MRADLACNGGGNNWCCFTMRRGRLGVFNILLLATWIIIITLGYYVVTPNRRVQQQEKQQFSQRVVPADAFTADTAAAERSKRAIADAAEEAEIQQELAAAGHGIKKGGVVLAGAVEEDAAVYFLKRVGTMERDERESNVIEPPSIAEDDSPLPSQGMYEHTYFSLYDVRRERVYNNLPHTAGWVNRGPTNHEKKWFDKISLQAAAALGNTVQPSDCISIRYRLLEMKGVEVEVSCICESQGTVTVSLLEPLSGAVVVNRANTEAPQHTTLMIALALSGRLETLKVFLSNLQQVLHVSPQSVQLTVVYFEDVGSAEVARLLTEAQQSIPGLNTELLLEKGQFSRGTGLRIAMEKTKVSGDNVVTWLCDVDMLFNEDFLRRCRSTPILGRQMFFPTPFSQYNPVLLEQSGLQTRAGGTSQIPVVDDHGYWRIYGHGNVCAYRQDLLSVSAFRGKRMAGWGGEDIILLQYVAYYRRHRIIRSLEPGLIHRYHPKRCEGTPRNMKGSCHKVRNINEGSQMVMAEMFFKSQDK